MDFHIRSTQKELSERKKQVYSDFSRVVCWGRKDPVRFAEMFYGVRLMDFQKYVFMESWSRPFVAWLMCRAAGKTTLMAVFLMTKMVLIPNYKVFIASSSADQSIEAYKKIEGIALNQIPSFKGLTDIFRNELVSNTGTKTGFGHNPMGYSFKLHNGSELTTLSSNEKGARGKRGSVWYDEAAVVRKELMDVGDHFANVDSNFSLGGDGSYQAPEQMPLQLIYTSSAGSVDLPFYDKIRAFTKHMIAGDPNYFVVDLDINAVLENSSVDGEPIQSHIDRAKVEKEVRDNPENAERELYNHFRRGAGRSAVVSEDCLVRNSFSRLPVLNGDGHRKFVFCYDPARNTDNSILSVFELVDEEKDGLHLHLVNVISMVNPETDKKTPLNYVDQLEIVRSTMIRYNGPGAAEWENIEFYIDAGSGGAPRSGIADQLLFPWKDRGGIEHRGIIDPEDKQYETDRRKHPDNAPIVHLLEPRRYKSMIYGALEEMTALNLVHFTSYDGYKDYILLPGEKQANGDVEYIEHKLSREEKEALTQIELAKNEVSYMRRYESPGSSTVTYDLVRERRNTMHDDRAYTIAMGAYALWEKRNRTLRARRREKPQELMFLARKPQIVRSGF